MSEIVKNNSCFVGYDYKVVTVRVDRLHRYLDGYRNFGWIPEDGEETIRQGKNAVLKLKRDRKIVNKMELTRLQQNFEACMEEADRMERSRTGGPMGAAISVGLTGTIFIAGSTFAVIHEPPVIWLCILLAVPGFAGWIAPWFAYRFLVKRRTDQLAPLLEQKYDEIYAVCEKGSRLLGSDWQG